MWLKRYSIKIIPLEVDQKVTFLGGTSCLSDFVAKLPLRLKVTNPSTDGHKELFGQPRKKVRQLTDGFDKLMFFYIFV
ncbi:MAG: hypothetical protein QME25_08550, partial [Bacteroidota bacterium]|nr:hypothetical protein [Bacteroidota bacterium]